MKLTVNVISAGRYWKAFQEIPNDLISDAMRKYAVTVSEDGDAVDESYAETVQKQRADLDPPKIQNKAKFIGKGKAFVKRGDRYVIASTVENLIPGEVYIGIGLAPLAWMRNSLLMLASSAKPSPFDLCKAPGAYPRSMKRPPVQFDWPDHTIRAVANYSA